MSVVELKKHILVVDDDACIRDLLGEYLKRGGFNVSLAANTAEAQKIIKSDKIDLMILDVMMPKENGITFLARIRPLFSLPVVFLSAADSKDQKIDGLNKGGDDYITKPFEPEELLARINVHFRRQHHAKTSDEIAFGDFTFNMANETLMKKEETVTLSSTEKVLLKTLCSYPRRSFSREELATRFPHFISERAIDVQITRLRKKIEENPKLPIFIQTVRHIGYAFFPS